MRRSLCSEMRATGVYPANFTALRLSDRTGQHTAVHRTHPRQSSPQTPGKETTACDSAHQ